jgi:hypothetical protein
MAPSAATGSPRAVIGWIGSPRRAPHRTCSCGHDVGHQQTIRLIRLWRAEGLRDISVPLADGPQPLLTQGAVIAMCSVQLFDRLLQPLPRCGVRQIRDGLPSPDTESYIWSYLLPWERDLAERCACGTNDFVERVYDRTMFPRRDIPMPHRTWPPSRCDWRHRPRLPKSSAVNSANIRSDLFQPAGFPVGGRGGSLERSLASVPDPADQSSRHLALGLASHDRGGGTPTRFSTRRKQGGRRSATE